MELAKQLSTNEIPEFRLEKQDVSTFGAIIRKREDFLHFSGNAQKGGDVIYTYLESPRS